jgi:3-phenylpropionate/cinnamic acid dioxygenase small subunit
MSGFPTRDDLIDFVYREADLIDERRFDDWLALLAEDGRYWIPLSPDQTDARLHVSILHEDKLLLKARIERLGGDRTFSQQPPSRCQHVLQRPVVLDGDAASGEYRLRTRAMYVEVRAGLQHVLACTLTHRLRLEGGVLRIVEKRVDLLNAGAPLPMLQLFP